MLNNIKQSWNYLSAPTVRVVFTSINCVFYFFSCTNRKIDSYTIVYWCSFISQFLRYNFTNSAVEFDKSQFCMNIVVQCVWYVFCRCETFFLSFVAVQYYTVCCAVLYYLDIIYNNNNNHKTITEVQQSHSLRRINPKQIIIIHEKQRQHNNQIGSQLN